MPLTQLDTTAALVIIDLQKGIVGLATAHPAQDIVTRAAQLARAFRAHGLPVVFVNVTGGAPGRADAPRPTTAFAPDWAELVADLEPAPEDILITKQRWGAFTGTELDEELRRRGVTQVVLAGIATSIGVESTARSAQELGYHVVLVVDAMTDLNPEAHRNSVERIFPRLGETCAMADMLRRLDARP